MSRHNEELQAMLNERKALVQERISKENTYNTWKSTVDVDGDYLDLEMLGWEIDELNERITLLDEEIEFERGNG